MTLKACCSSIFSILKRHMWLSALWFAGLFFCLPVQTAMILQDLRLRAMWENNYPARVTEALSRIFGTESVVLVCLLMLMAFISALVYGGYMHRPKQVDFYHSQPLSRSRLLAQNAVAGLAALFIPYIVNLLLTMVLALAMGAGGIFPWSAFFASIAIHTLYFTAIFATGLIAVVISGKVAVAGITGVFLLSLLPALLGLGLMAIGEFYPTFYSALYDWNLVVRWLSPAAAYITIPMNGMPNGVLPVIAYDALAFTAALLLYRKRGSEAAGQAIAFKTARPPLKYAMACLAASVFGLVFHNISGYRADSYFWWYFGAIAGGFLATQITEIVYAADFRAIFRHLRGLAIFLVVFLGLSTGVMHDVTGFNGYVPRADQVASAELYLPGINTYAYHGFGYMYGYRWADKEGQALERGERDYLDMGPVSSPAAIAAAVNIAALYAREYSPEISEAQMEKWRQEGKEYLLDYFCDDSSGYINLNYTSCKVVFTLKNGREIARDYGYESLPIQFLLDDIAVIYAEEDFRAAQLRALAKADDCYVPERLEIFELYYELPELDLKNADKRSALLAALRADLAELTVEQQLQTMPIGALVLRLYAGPEQYKTDHRPYRMQRWPIYASFTHTLAFLAETGYGPELWQPQLEDIVSTSLLYPYRDRYDEEKYGYAAMMPKAVYEPYDEQYGRTEINDPAVIADIIAKSYPTAALEYNNFIDVEHRTEVEVRFRKPGGPIYTMWRVFPY